MGCCVCPICLKTICVLKMNVEANGVCAQCAAKKDTKGPYFGHPTLNIIYQGKIELQPHVFVSVFVFLYLYLHMNLLSYLYLYLYHTQDPYFGREAMNT